ncbi:putative Exonuclease, DNA polymerase III, epsilon subunit family [Syntrophobacter sp. SbD1]|nr:putative Exonuclease, DNA polymerase III, epsilon subunit family [Syntrophobacter sp. SbD1]
MLLKDCRFCAIDLETTGLDPRKDEIIAFAAIPMRGSRIAVHEGCYTLVRPKKYKLEAMKFHGLSRNDLEGAPSFEEVAPEILKALDGIIVGHSVEYDQEFLKAHFKRIGTRLKSEYLDIVVIEQWLGRECGKKDPDFSLFSHFSLNGIMSRYGLKESYRHNAMADAFCAAQIFQMQMRRLADFGVDSLWSLKQVVRSCTYSTW